MGQHTMGLLENVSNKDFIRTGRAAEKVRLGSDDKAVTVKAEVN